MQLEKKTKTTTKQVQREVAAIKERQYGLTGKGR